MVLLLLCSVAMSELPLKTFRQSVHTYVHARCGCLPDCFLVLFTVPVVFLPSVCLSCFARAISIKKPVMVVVLVLIRAKVGSRFAVAVDAF